MGVFLEEEDRVRLIKDRVESYNDQVTGCFARAVLVEMALEENPSVVPDLETLTILLRRSNVISDRVIELYQNRLPEIQKAIELLLAEEDLGIR